MYYYIYELLHLWCNLPGVKPAGTQVKDSNLDKEVGKMNRVKRTLSNILDTMKSLRFNGISLGFSFIQLSFAPTLLS